MFFKKVIPYVLAILVFVLALVLLRPAPSKQVVVAAADLRAGHVLSDADLVLQALPADAVPADAVTDKTQLVGQSLRLDRGQGDVIRLSHLGEIVALQPDERAIAIRVTDASGLAGLLLPGQLVGVVATISQQSYDAQGSFSKAIIEGLRVLYVDPLFAASDASSQVVSTPSSNSLVSGYSASSERASTGTIVLAVPVGLQTIYYDFTAGGGITDFRQVNAVELLAALSSASSGAEITLYLMPSENAVQFNSPGLWLPDLIVTPGPTPTPTVAP